VQAADAPNPPPAFGLDEVKMVYLVQLGNFVDWPAATFASPQAPIVLGVIAPDPFDGRLDTLAAGRKVQGRPLEVRLLRDPGDLGGCHLVFVPRDIEPRWLRPIRELSNRPVLLVGETAGFAARTGIVGFYLEGQSLRLELNPEAAKLAGLGLSSRLLQLARTASDPEPRKAAP
jgi:hypothetical protein